MGDQRFTRVAKDAWSGARLWTCDQEGREALMGESDVALQTLFQHPRIADDVSVVKEPGQSDRVRRFRISTETKDRQGDIVRSRGIQLKNFRRNPVVLFAHNARQPPIGKSPKIELGDGVVDADVDFFEREVFEFADTIFRIVSIGGLKATSIGFLPVKFEELKREDDDDSGFPGIDFKKIDLLEFSIVPVPANPEAVARVAKDGAAMKPYLEWLDQVQDKELQIDSVLEDLGVKESDLMDLRRAADGGKTSLLMAVDEILKVGDVDKDEEGDPESESEQRGTEGDTKDAKGPISFRQAHPDGTPAQARDAAWDAGREVRNADVSDLLVMSAWREDKSREDLVKGDFKLPHHKANSPWAVNFRAVSAAIAALNGARGGVAIPDADRRGSFNHLARHIKDDFDSEPPELRWVDVQPLSEYPELFYWDYDRCLLLARLDDEFVDARAVELSDSEGEPSLVVLEKGIKQENSFLIQSIAGRKKQWHSRKEFLEWANEQGFDVSNLSMTKNFWCLVQRDMEAFEDLREISLSPNDVDADSDDCKVQARGGILASSADVNIGGDDPAPDSEAEAAQAEAAKAEAEARKSEELELALRGLSLDSPIVMLGKAVALLQEQEEFSSDDLDATMSALDGLMGILTSQEEDEGEEKEEDDLDLESLDDEELKLLIEETIGEALPEAVATALSGELKRRVA